MLSEEDKKKIEDFLTGESDANPESWLKDEDKDEAMKYGVFLANKKILKLINKMCGYMEKRGR